MLYMIINIIHKSIYEIAGVHFYLFIILLKGFYNLSKVLYPK